MEIQAGTVRLGRTFIMKLSSDLNQTMARFHQLLDVQTNFDIVYHTLTIGGKQALIYFVDGLTKDEVLLRIMQGFASIQPDDMPDSPHGFSKKYVPYGETGLEDEESQILVSLLSGLSYRRQLYEVSTGRMRDWDPLWILIRLERYYCLWKAISDISETSQRILEARILEKLSLRAIAQELNLTQREVKTRYEAACNVVRTRFLRYCTEKVEF